MEREVRVRFAPSPTGPLHIGGVRTALYNYLFAKKTGGKMLLRIEDTDQNRFVPGAEQYIFEALEWCGIKLDESPQNPGPHAPYRQSERKPMYMDYALKLVADGHAYYAFDTAEELEAMRERLKAAKVATPQYNAITRNTMRNSLTLPEDEVKQLLDSGTPYVIRLKVPRKEEIRLKDMIRGWVMVHSSSIDDKVLMKSDGMPTYHLANIVDDHLMEITHVIRGEEWLPSAPLHVLLYRYLGWEDTMPEFAHLPLLLKPDGNGKLSKRDGDKLGFPVFPLQWTDPFTGEKSSGYRESGYLPEAFVNFLAFLGWNPGTHQELFTMDELAEAFSIERIGKSGTRFDINKARWFNEQYLRAKPDAELAQYLLQALQEHNIACPEEKAIKIASVMKERVTFPQDFWKEAAYFFVAPEQYNEQVAAKKWNAAAVGVFQAFRDQLASLPDFSAEPIKALLLQVLEQQGMKIGQVMQALRLALTGLEAGPDLMAIIEIIGREETARRIDAAIAKLQPYAA
ncbi:MAG: glutamate--tRNA ligase [Adhaeribacter sp.]